MGLYSIILGLIDLYSMALVIYILMSWFPGARESSIGEFLAKICEPYLEPFRKIIPPIGMLDISPIVAILVLTYLIPQGVGVLFSWFMW
ncbi:YGGT family protein [Paraliobacillus sp. PM-2]|uniref:YggT family protein n=1 Tax=Paraliobacillus sp. PM-2 TaxID=1462524 RepID=UPI00061B9386|nr:YggT family protein [Paraliobacillus sp. PM-2]CQR47776.1 YGGT family protein [Paraliobacillus sp. PM-2]